jgi:hypothetical protein
VPVSRIDVRHIAQTRHRGERVTIIGASEAQLAFAIMATRHDRAVAAQGEGMIGSSGHGDHSVHPVHQGRHEAISTDTMITQPQLAVIVVPPSVHYAALPYR